MADISDVETALVNLLAGAFYPNGTSSPSSIGPVIKVRRGWPVSQQLDVDLRAGAVNVTVFAQHGMVRNTTRYFREWQTVSGGTPTMAVSVSGNVVTWSGAGGTGQVAGVYAQGQTFVYQVQPSDTPASVAAAFAGMIAGATASGPELTLPPGGQTPVARVNATGTASNEIRRQEQGFLISIWCPSYTTRDAAGRAVDQALAPVDFLPLADGSCAWLRYRSERIDDVVSKDNLWRRDLIYTAEFPTTIIESAMTKMFPTLTIQSASPALTAPLVATGTSAPIGAIRFDGFYASSATVGSANAANAAALSPTQWNDRLPFFATLTGGAASWPAATQATIDAEIAAAVTAGLDHFVFDSYQPTDEETPALTLYLSSTVRSRLGFCMLGQFSNWSLSGGAPYSAAARRDVTMFGQPGYVQVFGNRPLYYVLANGSDNQMATAITWLRAQSVAAGTGNPYVVLLAGAALVQYDNVPDAIAAGADAAGAYECPLLNGAEQPYSSLQAAAEADWLGRAAARFPMVPTAMTDFDPRPIVATTPFYYTLPSGWNAQNYYDRGTPGQVSRHIANLQAFVRANPGICQAGVGLVYAWNELVEGGPGLMPTYQAGNPAGNMARAIAVGEALAG